MTERLGVLLMTYGSPAADLHDLPRYLAAVRGGREPSPDLVEEFRRRYQLIGGSPLIPITRAQATEVEARLRADGMDGAATVGMRFSGPSILDGLRELTDRGCDAVTAIVMSPQYSELLMSGYRRAVEVAVDELGPRAPRVHLAPAWYRELGFIEAVTERLHAGLESFPDGAPVLLTAHSLPRRVADAEPAYLDQLRETAETVATAAGLAADRWRFCWQSAGHEPGKWMKPDFTDLLP
ncbi:MAG: ferrochelatase, partial [Chloroflexi bacterium]|nr:ferrochelatase [Chloroflexota bacterium]